MHHCLQKIIDVPKVEHKEYKKQKYTIFQKYFRIFVVICMVVASNDFEKKKISK